MGINAQIPVNLDFQDLRGFLLSSWDDWGTNHLCLLILRGMACFFHELVMLLLYMQQEMIRLPGGY